MPKCITINESFIKEYQGAFKTVTCSQINDWFDSLIKSKGEAAANALKTCLFESDDESYIRISGERLVSKTPFPYPEYIFEGDQALSDIDLLEKALRFIDIYDKEKRGYKTQSYPLFIALACLRSRRSIGGSSIVYRLGMLSISFSSNIPFMASDITNVLTKNDEFDFFRSLGLVSIEDIQSSLRSAIKAETDDGYWHSFTIVLDEKAHKSCLNSVRYWLQWSGGELSRKELQELMLGKFSERSVNDALHKLINENEVETVGNIYSPSVKYKYIASNGTNYK